MVRRRPDGDPHPARCFVTRHMLTRSRSRARADADAAYAAAYDRIAAALFGATAKSSTSRPCRHRSNHELDDGRARRAL